MPLISLYPIAAPTPVFLPTPTAPDAVTMCALSAACTHKLALPGAPGSSATFVSLIKAVVLAKTIFTPTMPATPILPDCVPTPSEAVTAKMLGVPSGGPLEANTSVEPESMVDASIEAVVSDGLSVVPIKLTPRATPYPPAPPNPPAPATDSIFRSSSALTVTFPAEDTYICLIRAVVWSSTEFNAAEPAKAFPESPEAPLPPAANAST